MSVVLKRTAYLGYYLKESDFLRLRSFATYVRKCRHVSSLNLYWDVLRSVYLYNIAPLDYFYFRFFEQDAAGRSLWAGTGYMYEYQRRMNPLGAREVLVDKITFLAHFAQFVRRPFASVEALEKTPELSRKLLSSPSNRVVLKNSAGQCGSEVCVMDSSGIDDRQLLELMRREQYDLAEGYVTQHPDLRALSPAGLNTIRVVTQLARDGTPVVLGVRLRITVNCAVDNMAAGNLAAPLDPETGAVTGPAVYSDITLHQVVVHPVTGMPIVGFKVPFWTAVLEQVNQAARMLPENRSVGWDVAVSAEGPELIEGNHNWCKLLWQLPVRRGLKAVLEAYK